MENLRTALIESMGFLFWLLFFWALGAADLQAQEHAPVKMGWVNSPPLSYVTRDGDLSGLYVDLFQELGREIGFEPQFVSLQSIEEWTESLATGQTEIIPGVPDIPKLRKTVLLSDQVFTREARLMIRSEDAAKFDVENLAGRRVATIPPTPGADPALLNGAEILELETMNSALIALLTGEVDAISTAAHLSFSTARAARLDDRVTFVGNPIVRYPLFIGLHGSRTELLGPLSAALLAMEADGRMQSLRDKYYLNPHTELPETLTVGAIHQPPYQVIEDGNFSGFAIQSLQELAGRAGLVLRFREITLDELRAGPGPDRYDILAIEGITMLRGKLMDFTLPIEQASFSIFLRVDDALQVGGLEDLVGLKVGVQSGVAWDRFVQANPHFNSVRYVGRDALLDALISSEIDAVLFDKRAFLQTAQERGRSGEIQQVEPPFFANGLAPALRPGLGFVRERLNAVIPGFLISDKYKDLRETWFVDPPFWTSTRVRVLVGGATVFIGVLFGFFIWQVYAQRQRQKRFWKQELELANEQRYGDELARLIAELERSNSDLNDFAYIASHDLKEPLRGIMINADFLLREDVSKEVSQRVNRMVELASRMQQLISDLLFFSRLGRDEKDSSMVDLGSIIKGLLIDLRETLDEKGGRIQIATDLPKVRVEPSRVKTVFQNLIMNGLIYNDAAEKVVQIGFENVILVDGQTLRNVFFVRDNGIGIEESNRDKVFRIFTRLNRESDYGRGTGAGLSFVKKVVEGYGGAVTFTSQAGHGTTFYFSLPLAGEKPLSNIKPKPERALL